MFFQQRDLMRPVSTLGQKKCGTKRYKIKIVSWKSKILRIAKLEVVNQKTDRKLIEIAKSKNMNSK